MKESICGANCAECPSERVCPGCADTAGCPFGKPCYVAKYILTEGMDAYLAFRDNLIRRINARNIAAMEPVTQLYPLVGSFVNLAYPLPGGEVRLLCDDEVYLGAQVKNLGDASGKSCFGVIAREDFLLICRYGENGADPELVRYEKGDFLHGSEPALDTAEHALDRTETARLILRRFCKDDLQDLYEYLSDEEVVRFEPYRPMCMRETAEELDRRISCEEMIAVELRSTGKMIGNVYLGKRDFDALEIGFVFNRQYWGQGYASESCRALIDAAFSRGVHRIYAECDPQNPNSWHLLEKLGFTREAQLRQNVYFWKDANDRPIWKDTYVYALVRAVE